MKKILWLIMILFVIGFSSYAQHLIGIKKDQVPLTVRKEMKGFRLDNSSRNLTYNYQKFINAPGTKTLIIFYDDKNTSVSTRLVCDYSELDFMLDELNKKYAKKGNDRWEYLSGKQKFEISLRKEEWYCVFSTKKSKR